MKSWNLKRNRKMDSIFMYAVKISLPIGVFILLYWLFLKDEKSFQLNRAVLLTGLVLGYCFPFIQFTLPEVVAQIKGTYELNPITINADVVSTTSTSFTIVKILSIIYILGTIVFAARFLFRLLQILFLTRRHSGTKINGFQTVYVKGDHTPFTFFNILFLPDNPEYRDPGNVILEHEKVHLNQLHTLDNLVVELAIIVQWFNPAVWLCKSLMNSVHEYAADKVILEKGYNKFEYQKLMVETSTGMKVAGLSSHFNATLLKKRITMMSNYKSNKLSGIKYIVVLSFFAIGLLIVAPGSTITAQAGSDEEVYTEVDKMPEYPGGMMEFRKFVAQNLIYPEDAKKAGIEGKVYVEFVIDVNGEIIDINAVRTDIDGRNDENTVVVVAEDGSSNSIHVLSAEETLAMGVFEKEAIRVVSMVDKFTPGEKDSKKVKVQFTFPITFALN